MESNKATIIMRQDKKNSRPTIGIISRSYRIESIIESKLADEVIQLAELFTIMNIDKIPSRDIWNEPAATDSAKEGSTTSKAAGAGGKRKFGDCTKKVKEEKPLDPSSKDTASGFNIRPTRPPPSDSEDEDDEKRACSGHARAFFA